MLQSLFLRKCRLVCLTGLSRNNCCKSNADICVIPTGNAGTSKTSERQGSRRPLQGWMLPIHAGMTITFVTACSKTRNFSQPLSTNPLAPGYRWRGRESALEISICPTDGMLNLLSLVSQTETLRQMFSQRGWWSIFAMNGIAALMKAIRHSGLRCLWQSSLIESLFEIDGHRFAGFL